MKRRSGKIFAATLALLVCLNAMPLGTLAAEGEQAEATTTEQQVQPAEQQPAEQPSVVQDEQAGEQDEQPVEDQVDDQSGDQAGNDQSGDEQSDDKQSDDKQAVEEQADDQSADDQSGKQEEQPVDEQSGEQAGNKQPADDQSGEQEEQPVEEEQTEEPAGVALLSNEITVSDDAAKAQTRADQKEYYVGGTGASDEDTNDGTKDHPYASLAKAVEKINAGTVDDVTIYLQEDITVNALARIADKHVTIDGQDHTVTRGDNFTTIRDAARGYYNPAMLEVTTPGGKGASLTLKNIILDDNFATKGTYFNQAYSSSGTDITDPNYGQVTLTAAQKDGKGAPEDADYATKKVQNTQVVQDAMIAAYGNGDAHAEIVLEAETVLKNFGGMSAVRVTGGGQLTMRNGSQIIDDTGTDGKTKERTKGDAFEKHTENNKEVTYYYGDGPVGAVWVQGNGSEGYQQFVMETGATISGVNGRAVYVDGGTAAIDGIIENLTGSTWMTKSLNGVAIHLRGGAVATLGENGQINNVNGGNGSSIVRLETRKASFTMAPKSVINGGGATGISVLGTTPNTDQKEKGPDELYVEIDGIIEYLNGATGATGNALNINDSDGVTCVIGSTAELRYNIVWAGAIYAQGKDYKITLAGKIHHNYSTQYASAMWMAHNYQSGTVVTMTDTAEIYNNISENGSGAGSAVTVSKGTFNMEGGKIYNNYCCETGNNSVASGAIFVQNNGVFHMTGGTISDNKTLYGAGAIYYKANSDAADMNEQVILEGGTISNNYTQVGLKGVADRAQYAVDRENYTVTPTAEGTKNDVVIGKDGNSRTGRYFSINDTSRIEIQEILLQKYGAYLTNPGEGVKFGNASAKSIETLEGASKTAGFSDSALVSLWCYSNNGSAALEFSNVQGIVENLPVYAAVVPVDANGDPIEGATVEFYGVAQQDGKLEVSFPASNENGYTVALVQPTTDYGTMAITMPETLDEKQADANDNFTLAGSASYTLSKNLFSMMTQAGNIQDPTFTIELDRNAIISADTVTLNSDIFTIKNTTYDETSRTLTVTCTLKDGWQNAANLVSTLQWTTVMPKTSFVTDENLLVTGQFDGTVNSAKFSVPADPAETLMVSGILIRTANVTVYMGGHGDTAVVEPDGNITTGETLPEPGFLVDFPGNVTSGDITLREQGGTKSWTLQPYDGSNTTVYRIDPGENQEALRVQFTDANGNTVVSDTFDVGTAVNQELTMDLYKGSVGEVKAYTSDGTSYYVTVVPGTLTVRGTTGNVQYGDKIAANAQAPAGKPAVKVADGTEFTINESPIKANADAVQLLFDDVINTTLTQQDRLIQLAQRADTVLGAPATGKVRNFTAKYLDLVDTSNGNAWVKASNKVTVCWPYPAGTDQNTEFTVLHFEDLHRDMPAGEISGDIASCKVETMTGVTKTATHIEFQTDSFSPFALVWYTDQTVGGSENDGHETSSGTTVQTTQNTQTTTSASTPAAAAPAAVIPQTSDESQPALWAGLLVFSGAALAALYLLKRRKQNRER